MIYKMSFIDWGHIFSAQGLSNLLLHVALIASLVVIFFFTYGSKVEREVVNRQTKFLVDNFTQGTVLLPDDTRKALKESINNMKVPNMKKADEEAAANNKKLVNKVTMMIGSLLAIVSVVVGGLWWMSRGNASGFMKEFSLKRLAIDNLVLIASVGITEFIFTTFVIKNYLSADPNFVSKKMVETTQGWTMNNCK